MNSPEYDHPSLNTLAISEINDDVLVVDVHWLDILQNTSKNSFTTRESLWYNNTGSDFFEDDVAVWVPGSATIRKVAQVFGGSTGYPNEVELTYERDDDLLITRPMFGIAPYGETGAYEVEIKASSHDSSETASVTTTTIIGEKIEKYGVKATPLDANKIVTENSTVEFLLMIENTGNVEDKYDLFIESTTGGWEAMLSNTSFPIDPYKIVTAKIILNSPEKVDPGSMGMVVVRVTSRNDTTKFAMAEFEAVIVGPGLPDLLPVGLIFTNDTVTSTVSNIGNVSVNDVLIGLVVDNISVQNKTIPQLNANSNENTTFNWTYEFNRTVKVFVDPMNNIPESNETNNIIENYTGTNWPGNNTRSRDHAPINDRPQHTAGTRSNGYGTIGLIIDVNESVVELGWQVTYSMEVQNKGENPDTLFLTAFNVPEGWISRFVDENNHEVTSFTIAGNSKKDVGFQMVIPWYSFHLYVEYEHEFDVEKFDDGKKNRVMFEKTFIYETGQVNGAFFLKSGSVVNAGDNMELETAGNQSGETGSSSNHYFFSLYDVNGNTKITSTIEWEDEDESTSELILYLVVFVIIMIVIMLIVKFMLKGRDQNKRKSVDEAEEDLDGADRGSSDNEKSTSKKRNK